VSQEDERRRQAPFGLMEVMLRHPGRVEAPSLRMRDLLRREPIALGGTRLVEKAREKAEPLGS
jgi:hypothetical protein